MTRLGLSLRFQTSFSFKPSRSNRRDSDPQLEYWKGLAVAFIYQADSVVEKERRRLFVAEHFGIGKNHYKDWESLAEKGSLRVPDFSDLAAKGLIIPWSQVRGLLGPLFQTPIL